MSPTLTYQQAPLRSPLEIDIPSNIYYEGTEYSENASEFNLSPDICQGDFSPTSPAFTSPQQALSRSISEEGRSEEHTSELQSQSNIVCRLLLEKKKQET